MSGRCSSPGDLECEISIFLPGVDAREMSRECDVTDDVIEDDRVNVGTKSVRRRCEELGREDPPPPPLPPPLPAAYRE